MSSFSLLQTVSMFDNRSKAPNVDPALVKIAYVKYARDARSCLGLGSSQEELDGRDGRVLLEVERLLQSKSLAMAGGGVDRSPVFLTSPGSNRSTPSIEFVSRHVLELFTSALCKAHRQLGRWPVSVHGQHPFLRAAVANLFGNLVYLDAQEQEVFALRDIRRLSSLPTLTSSQPGPPPTPTDLTFHALSFCTFVSLSEVSALLEEHPNESFYLRPELRNWPTFDAIIVDRRNPTATQIHLLQFTVGAEHSIKELGLNQLADALRPELLPEQISWFLIFVGPMGGDGKSTVTNLKPQALTPPLPKQPQSSREWTSKIVQLSAGYDVGS